MRTSSYGAGFWKRPTSRMYSYNLDLGEHYYNPMTSYLDSERGWRAETPGAMTFSERLSRNWLRGRTYGVYDIADRYLRGRSPMGNSPADRIYRAVSVAPEFGVTSAFLSSRSAASDQQRMARASSEARCYSSSAASFNRASSVSRAFDRERTPPFDDRDPLNVRAFGRYKQATLDSARNLRQENYARQNAQASRRSAEISSEALSSRAQSRAAMESSRTYKVQQRLERQQQQQQQQQQQSQQQVERTMRIASSANRSTCVEDDILKKITDVHMLPFSAGAEMDEAKSASARARTRITELERELEEITRKALSTKVHQERTASQLAKQAMAEEDSMASSYKKSRTVMVQSSGKMTA